MKIGDTIKVVKLDLKGDPLRVVGAKGTITDLFSYNGIFYYLVAHEDGKNAAYRKEEIEVIEVVV